MKKGQFKAEEQGYYPEVMPKMNIMQPTVVNKSSQNVASEEIPDTECGIYDTEMGVILQKIDSFDFDNREDGK